MVNCVAQSVTSVPFLFSHSSIYITTPASLLSSTVKLSEYFYMYIYIYIVPRITIVPKLMQEDKVFMFQMILLAQKSKVYK